LNFRLPEIIHKFRTDFIPAWEGIKDQFVLFKIEKFANELKAFAENYEIVILIEYADKIIEDLDVVDLESLSDILADFSQIVDKILSFSKN